MYYHAIAVLPGSRRKCIENKNDEQIFEEIVLPFVSSQVIELKRGKKSQSFQVLELRIYKTTNAWARKDGISLEDFLWRKRNIFSKFEKRAQKSLGKNKTVHRVFIIMPIQGEKFGSQDEMRIYREFDERFKVLEELLGEYDCVAIRIDKQHPLDELVKSIKEEIAKARFIIADLTDERPSCYFEAGYAEALHLPIIYLASKESIVYPRKATQIHFDVHMNVNYFANHKELEEKLRATIDKNREKLFATERDAMVL